MSSTLPSTYASGLLISCATPAARRPSDSMRSADDQRLDDRGSISSTSCARCSERSAVMSDSQSHTESEAVNKAPIGRSPLLLLGMGADGGSGAAATSSPSGQLFEERHTAQQQPNCSTIG